MCSSFRLFVNRLFCCFISFLDKDTARFWQPGECGGTQTGTLCSSVYVCACMLGVCPSMVVLVLSVQCLPPPSSLWCSLSCDAVCIKVQDDCVFWSWQLPRLFHPHPFHQCVSPPHVHSCCFFPTARFSRPPSIDFHSRCSIVHLLSHSAGNVHTTGV